MPWEHKGRSVYLSLRAHGDRGHTVLAMLLEFGPEGSISWGASRQIK